MFFLSQKNRFSLKAQGDSMLPLLHSGDVVFYKKIKLPPIKVNDLILVSKNKKYFTHRVIYKTAKYLITKGDNNPTSDGRILPRHIIAKTIKVKRSGEVFDPESLYLIQSTLYLQEIIKIKLAFEKAKIDFVFLKGLPLHLSYEGKHPRRVYADCDILLERDIPLSKINHLFSTLGYRHVDNHFSEVVERLRNKITEMTFIKQVNGYTVVFDIHWEINLGIVHLGKIDTLYPQSLNNALSHILIKERKIINTKKNQFPILSTDNLVVYLSLHFALHNFQGIFRLEFLDKVIRALKSRKNWTAIQCLVLRYKLQNFTYPTFVLLQKYYKTPIPTSFLRSIRPRSLFVRKYISQLIVKTNMFDDESRLNAGVKRFKHLFFLSPRSWWVKIWVFATPQVAYSIFWVIRRRFSRFFSFSGRR